MVAGHRGTLLPVLILRWRRCCCALGVSDLSVSLLAMLCACVLAWRYWLVFHGASGGVPHDGYRYASRCDPCRMHHGAVRLTPGLTLCPAPKALNDWGIAAACVAVLVGNAAIPRRSLPPHGALHPAKPGDRALDLSGGGQSGSAAVSLVERPPARVYRNDFLHDLSFASRHSAGARQALAAAELGLADARRSAPDAGGGGTDAPLGRAALRPTAQTSAPQSLAPARRRPDCPIVGAP